MWQMFVIWRKMNTPLPQANPFRRILHLRLSPYHKTIKKTRLERFLSVVPSQVVGCFTAIAAITLTVWISCLCIIFVTPIAFALFGFFPYIFFGLSLCLGNFLQIRIINKLNKIRTNALYDLIGASTYGIQRAMWVIARTIYRDILWLRDTRIMFTNGVILSVALLLFTSTLGILDTVGSPSNTNVNAIFLYSVFGLITILTALYFSFVHALVLGYLTALWSMTLDIDAGSRVVMGVGSFWGFGIIIYLGAFLVCVILVPALLMLLNLSNPFLTGLLQLGLFTLIQEVSIRSIMRYLAYHAELPYESWRLEVGI